MNIDEMIGVLRKAKAQKLKTVHIVYQNKEYEPVSYVNNSEEEAFFILIKQQKTKEIGYEL
jgi:hypothetical protein